MLKVDGVNRPQLQFLTSDVCDQQIDIDTDFFCYVPNNNQQRGSISQ